MYFRYLKVAIKTLFIDIKNKKGFISALINMDRIFNVISGGHFLTTISGRVGYFSIMKKNYYWKTLEQIIDFTFEPMEGKNHCYRAYQWEITLDRDKYRRGNDVALLALSLLVIFGCLILIPIVWVCSRFD